MGKRVANYKNANKFPELFVTYFKNVKSQLQKKNEDASPSLVKSPGLSRTSPQSSSIENSKQSAKSRKQKLYSPISRNGSKVTVTSARSKRPMV